MEPHDIALKSDILLRVLRVLALWKMRTSTRSSMQARVLVTLASNSSDRNSLTSLVSACHKTSHSRPPLLGVSRIRV